MLQILEIVGIALVVLTVYYLLCIKFPSLGRSQAFNMIVASRVIVKLQWACERAAGYLSGLFERSLNYPPGSPAIEVFAGLAILARIVYLIISLLIFGGELSNTLSAQNALWQTSTNVTLGGVEIASSALFLCTSAIFGSVLLECVKLIPSSCSLLVPMNNKWMRIIVGVLAGLFTLLSLLVIAYFYLFRAVYLINPDIAQSMTLWILSGLGIITAAASILGLWGIVLGLCGLFSCVCWLLSHGFKGLAELLSLMPSVLDVISLHLGGMSVFQEFGKPQICELPHVHFVPTGQETTALLPGRAVMKDAKQETIVPIETTENEVSEMAENLVGMTFDDGFGSYMIFPTKTAVDRFAARSLIRSSGRVGFFNAATPRPGFGVDVSPVQRMAGRREQCTVMAENSIKAHDAVSRIPAPMLHFLDCLHGDAAAAVALLEPLSRRLPAVSHLVVTACADTDLQLARVQEFFTAVQRVPHVTIMHVDTASDFAQTQGFPKLCTFIADAVVKLALLSPKQSSFNLSAVELAERLGSVSPVLKLSFAVAPVAPGKSPLRGKWLRLFTNRAVSGSYPDALSQALSITKEVVSSPAIPSYLLFSCPFRDSRFHQFVQENNQQVTEAFPGTLTGAVAASGIAPLHDTSSPFYVGVAAFTPGSLPQSVKKEEKPKEEKQAATSILPADTVPLDVPAPAADSLVVNGKKNGRGRPTTKKEQ